VPHVDPRRKPPGSDPERHERELLAVVGEIARTPHLDARGLDRILKRHPRDGCGLFSRSELIAGFRRFAASHGWGRDEEAFVASLRLRPVRTQSGVTPVTVLTKPHPCPGRCIFCPDDVRMPKSYLSAEPGAQRAADNGFDPYRQTWNRLAAYRDTGHPVDKVELIVLGGTWSSYPEPYRLGFVKRCLDALDDFGRGADGRAVANRAPVAASWDALERAQRRNEGAACRCVGLAVETRPDRLSQAEVLRIRRLGATKVQIGVQSLSDRVLALNRRGHDVAATRRAFRRLRSAGFKIHAHWMPNLLGSSPGEDVAEFARLFDDPDFRPDELKVYPCSLVASADLMAPYRRGAWRPYREAELVEVLVACLQAAPRYCRLTRMVRDFSADDIVAGSRTGNLREEAERRLRERGGASREIRSREIRRRPVERGELRLVATDYATAVGDEVFLEFVTPEDRIAAFLRLSLPRVPAFVEEIRGSALVREVHVYGAAVAIGRRAAGRAQHRGLGRTLLAEAAARARAAGFADLAVISAVGTRPYYRGLGFRDGVLYQHRCLTGAPGPGSGRERRAQGSGAGSLSEVR
jgi:elongator complex protein 3